MQLPADIFPYLNGGYSAGNICRRIKWQSHLSGRIILAAAVWVQPLQVLSFQTAAAGSVKKFVSFHNISKKLPAASICTAAGSLRSKNSFFIVLFFIITETHYIKKPELYCCTFHPICFQPAAHPCLLAAESSLADIMCLCTAISLIRHHFTQAAAQQNEQQAASAITRQDSIICHETPYMHYTGVSFISSVIPWTASISFKISRFTAYGMQLPSGFFLLPPEPCILPDRYQQTGLCFFRNRNDFQRYSPYLFYKQLQLEKFYYPVLLFKTEKLIILTV